MSYEDDNKKFKKFFLKRAKDKNEFYTNFIKYVKKKIPDIVLDPDQNPMNKQIRIQKIVFHALEYRSKVLKIYPTIRQRNFTQKYLTFFDEEVYEKAQVLFQAENEIEYYGNIDPVATPSNLIDDIVDILNIINIPYSDEAELTDDMVYLVKKDDGYHLDNVLMKFNRNSIYLPILDVLWKRFGKEGGSISFDNLIKISANKIPDLQTAPNRKKEQIYKKIKSSMLTNGNGIRRASGSKSGLMSKIIYSEHGSNIITFKNIR